MEQLAEALTSLTRLQEERQCRLEENQRLQKERRREEEQLQQRQHEEYQERIAPYQETEDIQDFMEAFEGIMTIQKVIKYQWVIRLTVEKPVLYALG